MAENLSDTKQLVILEQRFPPVLDGKPFRLGEVYVSVDGYRTRLTHRTFGTYEEAATFIDLHASRKGTA
jgi:hypothetical protein